jgi:hypothetical protein
MTSSFNKAAAVTVMRYERFRVKRFRVKRFRVQGSTFWVEGMSPSLNAEPRNAEP